MRHLAPISRVRPAEAQLQPVIDLIRVLRDFIALLEDIGDFIGDKDG